MVLTVLITWVPLLLLSLLDGRVWGGDVELTFLADVETQLRFLLAAPLLILAEVLVHKSLPPTIRLFVDNGLIREADRPHFDAAIASAMRLRNSIVVELLLVVFVYAVGMPLVWRDQLALDVNSWYRHRRGRRIAPVHRRLVAGAGEHAALPVPDPALVFPLLRLGAVPVPGRAHAAETRTDPSRTARPGCCSWRGAAAPSGWCCSRSGRCSPA